MMAVNALSQQSGVHLDSEFTATGPPYRAAGSCVVYGKDDSMGATSQACRYNQENMLTYLNDAAAST